MSLKKVWLILVLAITLVACGSRAASMDGESSGPKGVGLESGTKRLSGKLLMSVNGRIWLLSDGTWQRLSGGPNDVQPTWDSTGKKVYFVRKYRDYSDLYSVRPGKGARKLTSFRGIGAEGTAQYVYNSSWALQPSAGKWGEVYMLTDYDGFVAVAKTNARTPRHLQYVTQRGAVVEDPQISLDNRKLLYVAHPDGAGEIFSADARNGGNVRQLTMFKAGVYDPSWADKRGGILFVADNGEGTKLYLRTASGSFKQLTDSGAVRQPFPAGADGRIVYLRISGSGWDIWTAKVQRRGSQYELKDQEQVTSGGKLDGTSNISFAPAPSK